MSEAKFTKGEWSILPIEGDKQYLRIRGTVLGGRYKIANVDDLKRYHDDLYEWCKRERGEAMANAHLIAAAPEMYDLLSRLTNPSNCKKNIVHLFGEADSLLAKARGEHD